MYKIFDKIINFIMNAMENWRMKLIAVGQTLAEVGIQRDIFQEDSLSLLIFVRTMVPFNHQIRKRKGG